MKIIKILTIGFIFLNTLSVSAQGRGNKNSHSGNRGSHSEHFHNKFEKKESVKNHTKEYTFKHEDGKYRNNSRKSVIGNNRSMAVIHYNNQNYYYNKGACYKQANKKYVKVMPPVGLNVAFLPAGYMTINVGNTGYYYHNGIYYTGSANNYFVVAPPVGAVVYSLPAGYREIYKGNSLYFEFNGALYRRTTIGGQVAFQIIG